MFKKLRRSSKAKVEVVQRRDSAVPALPSIATPAHKGGVTFFDLPGEIRNDIYELIATSTKLHLFNPDTPKTSKKKTSSSSDSTTPGLKRTRIEYLPVLLSLAPIAATITDFDFHILRRVLGSLYATELKALRTNPSLTIQLRLRTCTDDVVPNLRRWCTDRADSLDRLPWQYVLQSGVPDGRVAWFAERVRVLFGRMQGDAEKFEIQKIGDALNGVDGSLKNLKTTPVGGRWGGGYGDDFIFAMVSRKMVSAD